MSEILTIDTSTDVVQSNEIHPLKVFDDSVLKKDHVVPDVPVFDKIIVDLAKRLRMTLKLYGALGIAAPQCGLNARIFVMSVGENFITCVNPKILAKSDQSVREKEMCLSYMGLALPIDRPEWIDVEYYDETGKRYEVRFVGLTSRIFQHELDHLNGVRMVDHVGPATLMNAKRKQVKLLKQYDRRTK